MLKWLLKVGCPWDGETRAAAAGDGRLEVLKWLQSTGRPFDPWDTITCAAAAEGGHLEVLKWLQIAGCPFDTYTCNAGCGRALGDADVAAHRRVPDGHSHVSCSS